MPFQMINGSSKRYTLWKPSLRTETRVLASAADHTAAAEAHTALPQPSNLLRERLDGFDALSDGSCEIDGSSIGYHGDSEFSSPKLPLVTPRAPVVLRAREVDAPAGGVDGVQPLRGFVVAAHGRDELLRGAHRLAVAPL